MNAPACPSACGPCALSAVCGPHRGAPAAPLQGGAFARGALLCFFAPLALALGGAAAAAGHPGLQLLGAAGGLGAGMLAVRWWERRRRTEGPWSQR